MYKQLRQLFAYFYKNDGFLAARDPKHLQLAFDLLISLFNRMGLKTNTSKAKAMTFLPGRIRQNLSDEAYLTGMDPEAREAAAAQKVRCKLCDTATLVRRCAPWRSRATGLGTCRRQASGCVPYPTIRKGGRGKGAAMRPIFDPTSSTITLMIW